jgi:hypothetical protein
MTACEPESNLEEYPMPKQRIQWAGRIVPAILLAISLAPGQALSQTAGFPRTQYKAEDIARARANIARFEWAKKIYQDIKNKTAYYFKMDREVKG